MAPRSVSTSYASFEAELEGAILHHTGAIDYYLETAAPKWTDAGTHDHASPHQLQMMYVADMTSSFWQAMAFGKQGEISAFEDGPLSMACAQRPPAGPPREAFNPAPLLRLAKRRPRAVPLQQVGESRLEQYLQQDLQRYMEGVRQQLESEASESEAAVLSVQPHARHSHSSSSGSGSFVRLPDACELGADDDTAALAPAAAAAAAAAAAMAAVTDIFPAEPAAFAAPGPPLCTPQAATAPATAPVGAAAAAPEQAAATTVPVAGAAAEDAIVSEPAAAEDPAASAAAALRGTAPIAAVAGAIAAGPAQAAAEASAATSEAAAPQQAEAAPATAAAAAAAAAAPVPPFEMECDEDIAAQKAAARMRLAELEGAAASGAAGSAAAASGKGAALAVETSSVPAGKKGFDDADSAFGGPGRDAGSLHPSRIPSRPRGLAGMQHSHGMRMAAARRGYEGSDPLGYGQQAIMQQYRFFQVVLLGLVCCAATLPAMWALQAYTGQDKMPLLLQLMQRLQGPASYLYLPGSAALLLYLFSSVVSLRPPLLHFNDPSLERRYLCWSNSGKLFLDSMFQVLLLVVGGCLWLRLKHGSGTMGDEVALQITRTLLAVVSMMGCGLPVMLLLLLRSPKYLAWREHLLAGSRVLSILAVSVMQMTLPADCAAQLPVSMPFVALAQLVGIACMQVRLATFVPCQVLHLFVLLWKSHATPSSLLHFAQLFGGGLFLPCLLLYSMELYSRKAFVSTVIGSKKTV